MHPMARVAAGDSVRTPLGKGVVREVRRGGRVVVEIQGRAVTFDGGAVTLGEDGAQDRRRARAPDAGPAASRGAIRRHPAPSEVDLHGLTVEEALARAAQALNDALLADIPELRLIHGRSGGRIRAALHRELPRIAAVRAIRLDPRNSGVTVVSL
jgi:dsDNA-specific endonuclease/ATPase MutS2